MTSVIDIDKLIALRNAKGWDQKQLAEAAGVDRSVISRLERSLQEDCRLSVLVALARALEAPAETLINADNAAPIYDFSPELTATIMRLKMHSPAEQHRVALIINAFLTGLEP